MASQKLTQLSALDWASDTLTYGVNDPAGTPASGKIAISQFAPFKFISPVDGDFSWVNQQNATKSVDPATGLISLAIPDEGATLQTSLRMKAIPTAPYVLTAAFVTAFPWVNYSDGGLYLRESSSGKLIGWNLGVSNGSIVFFQECSSVTSGADGDSSMASIQISNFPLTFLRIEDDGADHIFSYGFDGVHFQQFYSQANDAHMTPDEIGFGGDCNTNDGVGVAIVGLRSWLEE